MHECVSPVLCLDINKELIESQLAQALEAGGCGSMALQLLEAMWDAEMVIDLETYNSSLRTLEKCGAVDEALEVWKEIEQAQLKINLCTAKSIIGACIRGDRKALARKLATKFRAMGLQVDVGQVGDIAPSCT